MGTNMTMEHQSLKKRDGNICYNIIDQNNAITDKSPCVKLALLTHVITSTSNMFLGTTESVQWSEEKVCEENSSWLKSKVREKQVHPVGQSNTKTNPESVKRQMSKCFWTATLPLVIIISCFHTASLCKGIKGKEGWERVRVWEKVKERQREGGREREGDWVHFQRVSLQEETYCREKGFTKYIMSDICNTERTMNTDRITDTS